MSAQRCRAACLILGAALLLARLGSPALWQDESETALRAESILETGVPRTTLRGVLVTAQPSLAKYEGNERGVWTWNTWLPAYLTAASFAVLGRTPFAARLPFVLAAFLALWLFRELFDDETKHPWAPEAGLVLLALSPAFLLFSRQSRYYSLTALGTVLVLLAWRRLIEGKKHGELAVVLSLQFLLHSSFAFFAVACAALAADALLRGRECLKARYAVTAGATLALTLPVVWYFRLWDRPGNHQYAFVEAFEFLKTFLLWSSLFALPALLPAAVALKRRDYWPIAGGFVLLCGLVSEGAFSRGAAAGVLLWTLALALRADGTRRLAWLWLAATLGLLSLTAAEPYGRYLMGVFPVFAFLGGQWISELANGKRIPALSMAVLFVGCNLAGWIPQAAAKLVGAPTQPALSVSGMMRQRLRDARPRSDLARYAGELARGPRGYIEDAVAEIKTRGGSTAFSDADNLSLLFAAGVKPVYKDELATAKPDWLLLSPWLRLDGQALLAVSALASGGAYEAVPVPAPVLAWQNNPDPLFRDFAPKTAPLALFRRRSGTLGPLRAGP